MTDRIHALAGIVLKVASNIPVGEPSLWQMLMNVLKMLLMLLPFILLCIIARAVNLRKTDASKQFVMPAVAVLYCFIMMLLLVPTAQFVIELVYGIPTLVRSPAGIDFLPDWGAAFFIRLGNKVRRLILSVDIVFWSYFLTNTFIFVVYLIIKRIFLFLIRLFSRTDLFGALHERVASEFYFYFSEKSVWCLKKSSHSARGMARLFYMAVIILGVLAMLISRSLYYEGLLRTLFYPVFGAIIIGEIYFFLNGLTVQEYCNNILGEDDESYRIVNYSLLRTYLRSLFGDKVLSEGTSVNNGAAYDITTADLLKELEASEDAKIVSCGEYFSRLNKSGFMIDKNYLSSSLDLLCGRSVLFNNPFYSDLIPYAFYPMNRCLLEHKKVLVVLGRHSIEDDILRWIEDGVEAVTGLPFMWKIKVLSNESEDADIGIVTRSDVFELDIHNANADFLEQVGFVIIIEPSKLMSTAQIGLNMLIKQCKTEEKKEIVYCLCDKNCDGLVDAASHALMTSITEVCATQKHTGTSSYMCWKSDSEYLHHRMLPNISRYLGVGTELSFAALKSQVSKTVWYGGEAFPVTDMRWIAKQYYYELMSYAALPANQELMDEMFIASPNMWSAGIQKNCYVTVEDESYNMFEMLRAFSTRSSEQGFVNIITSDYLLRDYMADNASIFEVDAKAIPYISADYIRSARNTVMRLILMMSTYPVSEDTVSQELSLLGISVFDVRAQLWFELLKCYGIVSEESGENYVGAVYHADRVQLVMDGKTWSSDIFVISKKFNMRNGELQTVYQIRDTGFISSCVSSLRSASYVAEDEKGSRYYLGSELAGHIYQKHLPGQFFTFGGKYYEMLHLTADGQALVRRAADHISNRRFYRQIREYSILRRIPSTVVGSSRDISGMKVAREFADISVATPGYYSMESYNDFCNAKLVLFDGDDENTRIPKRCYRNKEILAVTLPDMEEPLGDSTRYTITLLFNEVFRTLFAENHEYICAVTDLSFMEQKQTQPLTYLLDSLPAGASKNTVYIIEDSELDLGLTIAVERNLDRIFEIIRDYLQWHELALSSSVNPQQAQEEVYTFSGADGDEKAGAFSRLFEKLREQLREIFGRRKKANACIRKSGGDTVGDEQQDTSEELPFGEAKPYHERYYLLYGADRESDNIDLYSTFDYLSKLKLSCSSLKQAREGVDISALVEKAVAMNTRGIRHCDFCGARIYSTEYELLADGRERCILCSRTAVRSSDEFRILFEQVKRNMEAFYRININVGIKVEMVNAKTLHRKLGSAFIATPESDARVLGVAIKERHGYSLLIENGSPRMSSMLTMAHELTHIWQYINWNDKYIVRKYGKKMRLEIYEGMAKWTEIQYAYLINEPAVAKREEMLTVMRQDEYGYGFIRYRENYPLTRSTVISSMTPFMNLRTPLAPEYCGVITKTPDELITPHDDKRQRKRPEQTYDDNPIKSVFGTPLLDGPSDRDPNAIQAYAYSLLGDDEKLVYDRLLSAVLGFEEKVESMGAAIDFDAVNTVFDYILRDHPELFWVLSSFFYTYDDDGIVTSFTPKYCMTDKQAQERRELIEESARAYLSQISDSMSDFAVVLTIYEALINNLDYDTISLERQKRTKKGADGEPDDLRSIYGALVNKKAVCAGYAKAFNYLLGLCGIECIYVKSEVDEDGFSHAWNMIKLEGDWYHIDVTWGDGSNTDKSKQSERELALTYDYFCITTKELERISKGHTPLKSFPLPECTSDKCNYFVRSGLCFSEYNPESIRELVCSCLDDGKTKLSVKFTSGSLLHEAVSRLVEGGEMFQMLHYASLYAQKKHTRYSYVTNESVNILTFIFG